MSGLVVQVLMVSAAFILAFAIVILFPAIRELFSFEIAWAVMMSVFVAIFEIIKMVLGHVRTEKGRATMTVCPKCGGLKLGFSISTAYGEEKVRVKCYDCGEEWSKYE